MNNDLISRSAMLEDIQTDVENGGVSGMVAGTLKRYVKRAPAVDAVIPVRCRDCKHFCPCEGEEHKGVCDELVGLESCVYEDEFCS